MNSNKKFAKRAVSAVAAMALSVSALGQTAAFRTTEVKAAGSDNYAKLLQESLYFYDANMCGKDVESKGLIQWRSNCHTQDEVQGGFHDAGDHAMFGLPQGFTASVLGWSYYEFKDAYDATGQSAHFKTIMNYFCDFFKASTKLSGDSVSNFLYQKGDGTEDHAYWGAPEQQTGARKMFWTSNGASDIAADYAAALAINYLNFGNTEDLKYAEALYKFSTQYNQVATDGPNGFYKSSGCQDEQANAAGWLYLATKNEKYKNECAEKQTKYIGWADGWDNRGLGAACVYALITEDWSKVNGYLGSNCTGSGYLCMDDWGSARLNCLMQFPALVATKHSSADYSAWCKGQMNYILGDNPFNICMVTGFSSNSAKNAHHRAASGYQGYSGADGLPEGATQYHPSKGHVLIGALVGGPNKAGQYSDIMTDYQCNEVAIDYNSGLVGSAAGLYSVFKTGQVETSIPGVKGSTSVPVTPTSSAPVTPTTTTPVTPTTTAPVTPTSSAPSSGDDIVLLPKDMTVDTEEGDDKEINNFAEFSHQGAKSATLYVKVNSSDTEISGAFGTWNGDWLQEDFKGVKVSADKTVTVDYTVPSNAGAKIKAMIFWPHGDGVTIEKVVLHKGSGTSTTTPTVKPTATTSAPPATNPTSSTGTSANDIVLLPKDMTVDTEEGEDKEINNFAEFAHQGAKSATLYVKVNSSDTEISGAFGTWNGDWLQEDFKGVKVSADKTVTVDYTIPSNAGAKIKAMIFWPHGDGVTIEKVVLHKDGAASTPTTTVPTVKPTATSSPTPASPTVKPTATTTPSPVSAKGDADANGVVNTSDIITLMEALIGKTNLSGTAKDNADMNSDGRISILDLIMLKNKLS